MQKLLLSNRTECDLRVILEPNADVFDIPVNKTAEIFSDSIIINNTIEIGIYSENCVSLLVIGDVKVNIENSSQLFPY